MLIKKGITKIENIFFVLSIFFGIAFIIITPPFQVPDEPAHLFRAYQISEGKFIQDSNGDLMPKNLIKTANEVSPLFFNPNAKQDLNKIKYFLNLELNKNNKKYEYFPGTAVYTPIVYIPQAIGINIAKLFGGSALLMLYFGRFVNLLFWIAIIYMSLRIMPFKKNAFLFLALLPMGMYQASSLSADAITNAIAFFSVALILYYAFTDKLQLQRKHFILLCITFVLLTLCKQVYFLFAFLFLLIPKEKFKSKKDYYIKFLSLIGICTAFILIWILLKGNLEQSFHNSGVFPKNQIKFVLIHPFTYIGVICKTLYENEFYMKSFIGVFGWLDTKLPNYIYNFYFIMFILCMLESDKRINYKHKSIIVSVYVVSAICVMTALYVIWTPVGNNSILGIQGRYFIPIAPLLILLINTKKLKFKNMTLVTTLSILFCLTVTVVTLIKRFYVL